MDTEPLFSLPWEHDARQVIKVWATDVVRARIPDDRLKTLLESRKEAAVTVTDLKVVFEELARQNGLTLVWFTKDDQGDPLGQAVQLSLWDANEPIPPAAREKADAPLVAD
jgi:hypothetical protein